tara:strand:+ start:777 stop:914 length:138 start_codon:yes stop_codon:yes gene_type:complete
MIIKKEGYDLGKLRTSIKEGLGDFFQYKKEGLEDFYLLEIEKGGL